MYQAADADNAGDEQFAFDVQRTQEEEEEYEEQQLLEQQMKAPTYLYIIWAVVVVVQITMLTYTVLRHVWMD